MAAPHISPSLAARRLKLISATVKAGRDKTLDFEMRVRCARAAAIGSVLFGTPQMYASDGSAQLYSPPAAVNTLKLPTAKEVGHLLDIYRTNVEWMCNVVLVDLNRGRIENFLNWYHSKPATLPADPPLVPLVLVILALAIQARRTIRNPSSSTSTSEHRRKKQKTVDEVKTEVEEVKPGGVPGSRAQSPRDEYLDNCSSEKELLETAGACIDALQIACPSNWASAFSAPLDLVRANLLRGLWHLAELHLQFAGSCFAVTMRLAHAAALNRDARHWQSMGKEEAQARRNMFWNVATLELLHTNRVVQPPSILPGSYDTTFPNDHEALLGLFKRAGLIEPYVVEGRRSSFRVAPLSKASFDFHLARFQLTDALIKGTHPGGYNKDNGDLAEVYEEWKTNLPASLGSALQRNELDILGGDNSGQGKVELDAEAQTRYLQDALLQMISLSTSIQIHRPQVDETGRWRPPEGQAQRSLELCIDSAQRLIWLIWSIVTRDPGPPFILYNFCIFYCFQAAIIIAIQSALCNPGQSANEPSTFAVLARPSLDKAVRTLDVISSKKGLRLIAEQASRYASTLREIDIAQQRSKTGQGRSNVSPTVPGEAMLAPPQIVVEGSGNKLGGQGYPSRHPSRSNSPVSEDKLPVPSTSTVDITSANQFEDMSQSQSFGFDFSDLQVFPPHHPSHELSIEAGDQGVHGYADRPLHELQGSTFNSTGAPLSYTRGGASNAHHSTGLDLLAAQVDEARNTPTQMQWHQQQQHDLQRNGSTTLDHQRWPSSSLTQQQNMNGQVNSFPSSLAMWDKDNTAEAFQPQPASAPTIESMGATFATDWTEWERAVERLLQSDR
jgi:hypothetical protein